MIGLCDPPSACSMRWFHPPGQLLLSCTLVSSFTLACKKTFRMFSDDFFILNFLHTYYNILVCSACSVHLQNLENSTAVRNNHPLVTLGFGHARVAELFETDRLRIMERGNSLIVPIIIWQFGTLSKVIKDSWMAKVLPRNTGNKQATAIVVCSKPCKMRMLFMISIFCICYWGLFALF